MRCAPNKNLIQFFVLPDSMASIGKKVETDPITTAQDVTPYAGSLETRHWGQG